MRRILSLLVLVASTAFSVATSDGYKPDTGVRYDTGYSTTTTGGYAWLDDADATIAGCDSHTATVTASLTAECLATPEPYAWGYPSGGVTIAWTVSVGDTSGDTGEPADTSSTRDDTGWDPGGGPHFFGDTATPVDTGDTFADTGDTSTDTGAVDTGVTVDTGDTSTDTSTDTSVDTSVDTSIDTPADTSTDTGARDTGDVDTGTSDTGGDTGAVETGDSGPIADDTAATCPAGEDGTVVHVYVRDAAGELVYEDADTVVGNTPMAGHVVVDPAFDGCDADTACAVAWTVEVRVDSAEAVQAEVSAEMELRACSSGETDAASGALAVE